jgi:hypothetical protein
MMKMKTMMKIKMMSDFPEGTDHKEEVFNIAKYAGSFVTGNRALAVALISHLSGTETIRSYQLMVFVLQICKISRMHTVSIYSRIASSSFYRNPCPSTGLLLYL